MSYNSTSKTEPNKHRYYPHVRMSLDFQNNQRYSFLQLYE